MSAKSSLLDLQPPEAKTFRTILIVVSSLGNIGLNLFSDFGLSAQVMSTVNLAGRLGPGTQYWSWISLRDEVNALTFLLDNGNISGPVNLTGPTPVTNAEVAEALKQEIGRAWLPPIPTFAIKALLGEFSIEVL